MIFHSSPRFAHHSPPSPLSHKRQCLERVAQSTPSPAFEADVDMAGNPSGVDMAVLPAGHLLPPLVISPATETSTQLASCPPLSPGSRMQQSMDHLEAASQAVRLKFATKEQSDKSTPATYERHVNNYVAWWDAYQLRELARDPTTTTIPALPVTAAKVTMFLEYTSTRAKASGFLLHLIAPSLADIDISPSAKARRLGDYPRLCCRAERDQTDHLGARKPPLSASAPSQACTRVASGTPVRRSHPWL